VACLEPQLPACAPRHLSNVLWALAKLGYRPEQGFLSAWQDALLGVIGECSCRDVSNALWALATLRAAPPARLQQALLSSMHRAVTQGSSRGGGGGFGGGGYDERGDAGGGGNGGGTAQDAANALWALATLRITPPQELLASLCVTMQRQHQRGGGRGVKPQELANFLWGVGEQHLRARERAMSAARAAAAAGEGGDSLGGANSGGGRMGGGGAAGGVPPPVPPAWLHEQLSRCARSLGSWETRHLVMVLVACAQLRMRPPDPWLSGCLRALRLQLERCSIQVGCCVCWGERFEGVDRQQHASPNAAPTPMNALLTQPHAPDTHPMHAPPTAPQDLSQIVGALGALRVCPMSDWTASFLDASQPLLPAAPPHQLCALVKGVARLRLSPDDGWWGAFEAASLRHLQRGAVTPQGLAELAAAAAHAGRGRLSGRWGRALEAELHRQVDLLDPRALVKALWAAGRLQLRLRVELKHAAASALAAPGLLRRLSNDEFVRLAWAVVVTHMRPGRELADGLAIQLAHRAGALGAAQLTRSVWAVARLWTAPRAEPMLYCAEVCEARAAQLGLLASTQRQAEGEGGGAGDEDGDEERAAAEQLGAWLALLRAAGEGRVLAAAAAGGLDDRGGSMEAAGRAAAAAAGSRTAAARSNSHPAAASSGNPWAVGVRSLV